MMILTNSEDVVDHDFNIVGNSLVNSFPGCSTCACALIDGSFFTLDVGLSQRNCHNYQLKAKLLIEAHSCILERTKYADLIRL